MKYFTTKNIWQKEKEKYIRLEYPKDDKLGDFENAGRIFSITKIDIDNTTIKFREECDQIYNGIFSKEEAVEMLQEAIDWIKNEK